MERRCTRTSQSRVSLAAALVAAQYEHQETRRGYHNEASERTLTGPMGPLPLTVQRVALQAASGAVERRYGSRGLL